MAVKTEDGREYPASAYLYVPDPDRPSTWKLRIWETPEEKVTVAQLGRAAAALGPGFRGNRVELPPEERRKAARRLIRLYHEQGVDDEEIPDYLFEIAGVRPRFSEESEYVERDALLFEAGDYPDKGITVTEEHIQRLAQTEGEIPILVEHAESPVRLGIVSRLWAQGRQLWGKLQLLPEANALLERLGVHHLSISIPRTLDRILEVSVTGTPRVPSARMFHADVVTFAFGESPPNPTPQEGVTKMEQQGIEELRAQNAELRRQLEEAVAQFHTVELQLKRERAQARVERLIEDGKMPPAFREPMVELLMSETPAITFSDGSKKPVGEVMLEIFAQTPSILGKPIQPVPSNSELAISLRELGFPEEVAKFASEYESKK